MCVTTLVCAGAAKNKSSHFRCMRGEAVDLFCWFLSATWLCEPRPLKAGSGYAINLLISDEAGPGCFENRASLDQNLHADNQTQSSHVHSMAHSNQTVVARIP